MTVRSRTTRAPAVALGSASMVTSTALLGLQIILTLPSANESPRTRAVASAAAATELGVLSLVSWLLVTCLRTDPARRKITGVLFGAGIGLCVVAAVLTAAALIQLSIGNGLGASSTPGYLAATCVVLVMAFAAQLVFLVVRFVAGRVAHNEQEQGRRRAATTAAATTISNNTTSPSMQEILGGRNHSFPNIGPTRVKTVPYSSTTPPTGPSRNASQCSKFSPGPSTSSAVSVAETISSVASSLTNNVVRPITSRTRLLSSSASHSLRSTRSSRRPASLESLPRRTSCPVDDAAAAAQQQQHQTGFDSWDTSAVDQYARQTVLDHHQQEDDAACASPLTNPTSLSPTTLGRSGSNFFLETIPASPTTSRSPSPGTPLDFALPPPPRLRRRSRSFSPARSAGHLPLPRPPERALTQHASASESHIHPLFRSDSPTPPKASPGTVVIAAPQAGQVISDRGSIRSLTRMRSDSLPTVACPTTGSPLTASFPPSTSSNTNSMSSDEGGAAAVVGIGGGEPIPLEATERKVTPPIPEYILHAGVPARGRGEGPSGPGLDALPDVW